MAKHKALPRSFPQMKHALVLATLAAIALAIAPIHPQNSLEEATSSSSLETTPVWASVPLTIRQTTLNHARRVVSRKEGAAGLGLTMPTSHPFPGAIEGALWDYAEHPVDGGIPIGPMASMSQAYEAIQENPKGSFTAQQDPAECGTEMWLCHRMSMSGTFIEVSDEEEIALMSEAFFAAHPKGKGKTYPHEFLWVKFVPEYIFWTGGFGDIHMVNEIDVSDYLSWTPTPDPWFDSVVNAQWTMDGAPVGGEIFADAHNGYAIWSFTDSESGNSKTLIFAPHATVGITGYPDGNWDCQRAEEPYEHWNYGWAMFAAYDGVKYQLGEMIHTWSDANLPFFVSPDVRGTLTIDHFTGKAVDFAWEIDSGEEFKINFHGWNDNDFYPKYEKVRSIDSPWFPECEAQADTSFVSTSFLFN